MIILSRKPSFFKKIWPIDIMRDLQWFEFYSVVVTLDNISFMSEAF